MPGVTVSVRLTVSQSNYFFFFLAAFFFLATFLAFFFAAMINSSSVCSGRGDSGHPPKRHQYERLAFRNATPPGLSQKREFAEICKTPDFKGLDLSFCIRMKKPYFDSQKCG